MNIRQTLENAVGISEDIRLNDVDIGPSTIKAILINGVVPSDTSQDFYSVPGANYLKTTIPLMQGAGIQVTLVQGILQLGVYIVSAIETPKTNYAIGKNSIEKSLPYLEQELALFPNIKIIMFTGGIAKKAFNMITKKTVKKNVILAIPIYKLRNSQLYYGDTCVMPPYIMTSGNILIGKSEVAMATEDTMGILETIKS